VAAVVELAIGEGRLLEGLFLCMIDGALAFLYSISLWRCVG